MSIIQAATEAAKSSSAIFLDGVAIMALITGGSLAVREFIKTRRGRNGNGRAPKPGTADECLKHRDELTVLKERWTGMKEDITEVKGDVKTLLQRIPSKD